MAVPRYREYLPQQQVSPVLGGIKAATGALGTLSDIEARKAQEGRLQQQMQADISLRKREANRLEQAAKEASTLTPFRRELLSAQAAKLRHDITEKPMTAAEKAFEAKTGTNFAEKLATSAENAEKAGDAIENIDSFYRAYKEIPTPFKGRRYHPVGLAIGAHIPGSIPGLVPSRETLGNIDIAEKSSQRLVQSIIAGMHPGQVRNYLMQQTAKSTLGVGMSPEGVEKLAPVLKIGARSIQQHALFMNALKNAGIRDIGESSAIWQQYEKKYPLLNKKGEPQWENLEKWQEFVPNTRGRTEEGPGAERGKEGTKYTDEDISYTANLRGWSEDKVRQMMKARGML